MSVFVARGRFSDVVVTHNGPLTFRVDKIRLFVLSTTVIDHGMIFRGLMSILWCLWCRKSIQKRRRDYRVPVYSKKANKMVTWSVYLYISVSQSSGNKSLFFIPHSALMAAHVVQGGIWRDVYHAILMSWGKIFWLHVCLRRFSSLYNSSLVHRGVFWFRNWFFLSIVSLCPGFKIISWLHSLSV